MKEIDNIKDLFTDRFEDFEAHVDSSVWENVNSQIQTSPAPNSVNVSGVTSMKSVAWLIGVASVIGIIGIGYFALTSNSNVDSAVVITKEIVKPTKNSTNAVEEINSEPIVVLNEKPSDETVSNNEFSLEEKSIPKENNDVVTEMKQLETASENIDKTVDEQDNEIAEVGTNEVTTSEVEPTIEQVSKIVIADQSKVLVSPMGGNAPLKVSFSSLAKMTKVKWDFDDGSTSNEMSPNHVYETEGIYFVTMIAETESGEVVMDKAVVEVLKPSDNTYVEDKSNIFVPNIFTPNGDGINDVLIVETENIKEFTISIYSVNGKLVYQSNDSSNNWNGIDLHGNTVEQGTYYYLVNALGYDGNIYAPKGYITIR